MNADLRLIRDAEAAFGGTVAAAAHLGVSRPSWQRWKRGVALPEYIRRSIRAHLTLAP